MQYSLHKGRFPFTKKIRLGCYLNAFIVYLLYETRVAMGFPAKNTSSRLWCRRAGGQVDERTYRRVTKSHHQNFSDAWITKFSCLGVTLDTSAFLLSNLLSILWIWRLDLIFAILATLSNFYLSEQFSCKI